ncbi:hypothetical protein [Ilumatobacter sp.]|uniref:hypothetical protein n=1 Tax=Ilumatobacter sp. TaxID=1967498 RepID=UPI003B5177E0
MTNKREIEAVLQHVTINSIRDVLVEGLTDPSYRQFRFSVAFARWSGLFLLDESLQTFAGRRGTSIVGYVGTDLGGTTIEALTYLSELRNGSIYVVQSNMNRVIFHPKVYEFSGPDGWLLAVGSSNLTMGGILGNVEASAIVRGRGAVPPSAEVFRYFEPADPFTSDHVRKVTPALLAEIAPALDPYTRRSPDSPRSGSHQLAPLAPNLSLPNPGRPPSLDGNRGRQQARRGKKPKSRIVKPSGSASRTLETLFVEMWDETRDGTQVQLPKKVFTQYFGAAADAVTWIRLHAPGGRQYSIRLQGFPNATFRISLPFVGQAQSGDGRRAVLRFDRIEQDEYICAVAEQGDSAYEAWLAACTQQRSSSSKRFGTIATSQAPSPPLQE